MSETVTETDLSFKAPAPADGAEIWKLVRDSRPLDLNSAYAYLLLSHSFSDTCVLASESSQVVGFVSGFIPPKQPDCLFIWQVAVRSRMRGQGLAGRMLLHLLERPACCGVRFLETTVTPGNRPSRALFLSFAEKLQTPCEVSTLFPAHAFPEAGHEQEDLFRIGPINCPKPPQEEK